MVLDSTTAARRKSDIERSVVATIERDYLIQAVYSRYTKYQVNGGEDDVIKLKISTKYKSATKSL